MGLLAILNTCKKEIVFFIAGALVTVVVGGIGFQNWQKKVAKEALENIRLEQSFCDKTILVINEKIDELQHSETSIKKDIVLEYFDNVKNQTVSIKEIINRSKLTWANIFPEEAKRTEEFDSKLLASVRDVKAEYPKLQSFGADELKENTKAIKELELKITAIRNQINDYQRIPGFVYPSNFLSTNDNIVLPSGNVFDLNKLPDMRLTDFSQNQSLLSNLLVNKKPLVFDSNTTITLDMLKSTEINKILKSNEEKE